MAEEWRVECKSLLEKRVEEDEDRDWKALALITDAYGEWAKGELAKRALKQALCVHRVLTGEMTNRAADVKILMVGMASHQQSAKPAAHLPRIDPPNSFPSLSPRRSSSEQ